MRFGRKTGHAEVHAQRDAAVVDAAGEAHFQKQKSIVFSRLVGQIDASRLLGMSAVEGRAFIAEQIAEIILDDKLIVTAEVEHRLLDEICDDMLGYGPLERLLVRDDIADIMVNGPDQIFIETDGRIEKTDIRFRDAQQLLNVCQRIVGQVGRRVDESSPICDARLADGSRVNVVIPPLVLQGATLTIRRFRKERLTLTDLVAFGSISPPGAEVLSILARSGCNILVSGGTGSGKTTLLNCLTAFIDPDERVITCEDTAELQLQQPHVISMETRPANLEGRGEVTMRDLVKNCLRMRPNRIIVGEVRGAEAFDLMQAMNTGHDGSMGTLHANSPREAVSRIESMITMGYPSLKTATIREMLVSAVDVIVQAARLRDGSRRIVAISEVLGLEDGDVALNDLVRYEVTGSDKDDRLIGQHVTVGAPRTVVRDKAAYYDSLDRLTAALADIGPAQEG